MTFPAYKDPELRDVMEVPTDADICEAMFRELHADEMPHTVALITGKSDNSVKAREEFDEYRENYLSTNTDLSSAK